MLFEGHNRAKTIISENREKLEMIATGLLERETLDGVEVEEIVEYGRVLSKEERQAKKGDDTEAADAEKPETEAADTSEPDTETPEAQSAAESSSTTLKPDAGVS